MSHPPVPIFVKRLDFPPELAQILPVQWSYWDHGPGFWGTLVGTSLYFALSLKKEGTLISPDKWQADLGIDTIEHDKPVGSSYGKTPAAALRALLRKLKLPPDPAAIVIALQRQDTAQKLADW